MPHGIQKVVYYMFYIVSIQHLGCNITAAILGLQ